MEKAKMEKASFENVKEIDVDSFNEKRKEIQKIEKKGKQLLIGIIIGVIILLSFLSILGYVMHGMSNQIEDMEKQFELVDTQRTKEFDAKIDILTYKLIIRDHQLLEQQAQSNPTTPADPLNPFYIRSIYEKQKYSQQQEHLDTQRNKKKFGMMAGREVPGQNLLHDHQNEIWTEPTLGRPTKDTKFDFTEVTKENYYEFEKKMEVLFKPFTDTDCKAIRVGSKYDGGYILCENLINKTQGLINIGIMGYDEFGCDLTTKYNFMNYQYDCTDKKGDGVCTTNNGKNRQNLFCLSDLTETFEVMRYSTLQDMIDFNKLGKKHIIVKMDSEGSEWGALRSLPLRYLEYIDQLLIETHFYKYYKMYWGYADVMQKLSEYFVPITYNENSAECFRQLAPKERHYQTSACIESTLINKKLIKLKSENRSYKRHPLIPETSFPHLSYRCEMPTS